MLPCNASRMFRETIRTEYFSANWPNELSVCSIALKTKESKNSALAFLRRNYCRCHWRPGVTNCCGLPRSSLVGPTENERSRGVGIELSILVDEPAFCCC